MKTSFTASARARNRAMGSSAIVLAALAVVPAYAQCAPDPVPNNADVVCNGTDANGLVVQASSSRITVNTGAVVRGGRSAAVDLTPLSSFSSYAFVNVDGTVDGGNVAGVRLSNSFFTSFSARSLYLDLNVAAGATVTGSNGVLLSNPAGDNNQDFVRAEIYNDGTISGASGVAILATGERSSIGYLQNRSTGSTGAIVARFGTINNAGTIDGGSRSAVTAQSSVNLYSAGTIDNSGTITASSAAASIAASVPLTVTNSGSIVNRGTGAAIDAVGLNVRNNATGQISSAGATAIRSSDSLSLVNAGTIVGDVVMATSRATQGSFVDNSTGTITGNVRFGDRNDTLVVSYADGAIRTGISGIVDGGAGTDLVRINFNADASLRAVPTLPTNFEEFSFYIGRNRTVTLESGFTLPSTLRIGSATGGTVINRADLVGAARVIVADPANVNDIGGRFINIGSIRTDFTPRFDFAVFWGGIGSTFENRGTIVSAGGGVAAGYASGNSFINSGTITAVDTAVRTGFGGFSNSGTIRSLTGIGVLFDNNGSFSQRVLTNSGLIEGRTTGMQLDGQLVNSGRIVGGNIGLAVRNTATVINAAGATITGGSTAIGSGDSFPSLSGVTISNAGTINGDVILRAPNSFFGGTGNRYFAERGGVLNGNLALGDLGLFVLDMVNTGSGPASGVTGTITSTNSRLVYRVRADGTAFVVPGNFASVGYDLYNDARLTIGSLSAPRTLFFAGNGTVDTALDLTATFGPLYVLTTPSRATTTEVVEQNIRLINRGTLTLTRNVEAETSAVVVGGVGGTFTNAGTIAVTNRSSFGSTASAVAGGSTTINTGTILLNGAIGISNSSEVRNEGQIVQAAGGTASTGVIGVPRLVNTGTIEVGGPAVLFDRYESAGHLVINSGRIASTGGPAIADVNGGYYNTNVIRNLTGGTIAGTGGAAISLSSATVVNGGIINGTVRLGSSNASRSSAYVSAGGLLRGNLLFGYYDDLFVETDGVVGVTGTIDGGNGFDTYRYRRTSSGTVTLGQRTALNFEGESVEAVGVDTEVTVRGDRSFFNLSLFGNGRIVNTANISGFVTVGGVPFGTPAELALARLAGFTNQAAIGGFTGDVGTFLNSGTIGRDTSSNTAVLLSRTGSFSFQNDGAIRNNGRTAAVDLRADASIVAGNSGTIERGGIIVTSTGERSANENEPFAVVLNNSGTITTRLVDNGVNLNAVSLVANGAPGAGQLVANNSGTIEALNNGGTALSAVFRSAGGPVAGQGIVIQNSGTIRANGGGREVYESYYGDPYLYTLPANAILVEGAPGITATITNAAGGVIEATGSRSNAIGAIGATLDITNLGMIRGGAGTVLEADDLTAIGLGTTYLAGAVQGGDGNDRIVNTGTIIGSIALGGGDDRVENYGRIEGDVFLGAGDDTFLHRAGATQIGTVDAGEGDDGFILDATGGGSVNGDQFVNFERFSQIGSGNVTYSGTFRFNTVNVSGGSVTVAAGQTLTSAGDTAITGSDAAETVINNGTIAGSVSLGGGNDRVVNAGLIAGSVLLGTGDDVFVDQAGSRVTGTVDGGAGNDLYNVILAGNRNGLGSIRGFERLQVDGYGVLSLVQSEALDQIALNGTWLNLTQRGNRVGTILGSDAAEWVAIDGDASVVALAGGDDRLSLGTAIAAGGYDGGTGNDQLTFANGSPVTLTGRATGFEAVQVTGGSLTVAGLLANNGAIWFGDSDLSLTVANGATLGGAIDLGGGNDTLRLVGNAFLVGTASGGTGNDTVVFDMAGNRTLGEGVLTSFETLATTGSGILTLTGAHSYDRVTPGTDLTIAADGRLTARQVGFGAGDQRFTIAGQFAGAVDGGAGNDTISVSGGTASAPVAFDSIANVEAFAMTGGYATIAGNGAVGVASLSGGRLVGLAGSTITASQINVGNAAVFGSSGVVNGNLTVAGVLSPGSSIGTMVVNGNVTLLGGSTSLFELSQNAADRLAVNGALTIQNGATLQLAPSGYVRPGTTFELITATGGITGGYTNIAKPSSLFGYVAQQGSRILLIGQFRTDATFNPQVARSVAYANRTLLLQGDNSALGSALPALLTAAGDGNANPRQFALITPEAYASATQIGVDNALTLAQTTRGPAFATTRTDPGAYLFAQSVGQWHRLGADADQGIGKASSQGYGYLGGIGYGNGDGMVGMFAGWLDTRQFIRELGARTQADGVVVGGVARYRDPSGFGFAASIVYNDAKARTDRFVPGVNGTTLGRYDLTSWSVDQSIYYAAQIANGWAITPRVGATLVRTTREAVQESGSTAFALNVARDQHRASFVDAGITFGRSETSDDPFRPFVTLGGRYQTVGTRADALGGYAGGGLGLLALGVGRAPMVGTATGGVTYRYGRNLEIYAVGNAQTGRDDHQESILAGARLLF